MNTNVVFNIVRNCINWASLILMGYLGFVSVFALITSLNPLASVGFLFIWGNYQPYSYQVLIFVIFYFVFYPKFRWLSPFVLAFIWGFNDMFYNAYFDFFHLQAFIAGDYPTHIPDGWDRYLMIMAIEFTIMAIGAIVIHLRFNMHYSFAKYFGLGAVIINTVYVGLAWSVFPSLASLGLVDQFQSLFSIVGLLLFMYTSIVSRAPTFRSGVNLLRAEIFD